MWQVYWQKQLLIARSLLLGAFLLAPSKAWTQDKSIDPPLGIIDSLDSILSIHNEKFDQIYQESSTNVMRMLETKKNVEVKVHPVFMQSLLLYSPKSYVELLKKNECHLYGLLKSGLFKNAHGNIRNIIVQIRNIETQKIESGQVLLEDFIQLKTQKNCQNATEIASLFSPANLKITLRQISFEIPKTHQACENSLNEWGQNLYLPYLCGLNQKLHEGRKAKEVLRTNKKLALKDKKRYQQQSQQHLKIMESTGLLQRSFINSLCENIDQPQKYCSFYLSAHVWGKIINAEKPGYYMSYLCQDIFNNKKIDKDVLTFCKNELIKNPALCHNIQESGKSSLIPHANCNEISEVLNISRINSNYPDCPAQLDNEGISNYHRLIFHFSKSKPDIKQKSCQNIPINTFAKMNINYQNEQAWPLQVCYFDKFEDKRGCKTYIPGSDESEPLAETKVVSNIINKQLSLDNDVKCELVSDKNYKPHFLKFKNGCFIIYPQDNCTLLNCQKKIVIDRKEIDLIEYEGKPHFEYFSSSFANENFAQDNVLNESLKLKDKKILNLTFLKNFFKDKKDGLIHGVGCLEDLLPRYFQRAGLQSCTPHPFIIDGYILKNSQNYLSFRSSIESVHTPRFILWQNIFNAVANYRELHPLRKWALIGVDHEKN